MSVGGAYDCVTKTPMGDQKSVFTVVPSDDGTTFTGQNAGAMGTMEVQDGKIDGNTLTWTINMTVPMPMKSRSPDVTLFGWQPPMNWPKIRLCATVAARPGCLRTGSNTTSPYRLCAHPPTCRPCLKSTNCA